MAGASRWTTELCIVGAGAAGLWAAARAARAGASVLVLEKTGRCGTKILASGGTRCNLTTALGPREAARLFGPDGGRFLSPAFRALPPEAVRAHFAGLGVPTKVEAEGDKVFPRSDSARDVRDALLADARAAGACIRLQAPVSGVVPEVGGWTVRGPWGSVACRRVLLCPGGRSYPRTGTTGDGYAWLEALGLELVPPVPALVPLRSPAGWVRGLTGLSVDVEVRAGRWKRRRPLLFTHTGVSGPAAMDVSEAIARGVTHELVVDLLPATSREELRALFIDAAGRKGAPRLASLLPLPRRLVGAVARHGAALEADNPRAQELGKAARHRLIEALKGLRIPVDGTLGYAKAEVTAGGLALGEVDPRTLEVRGHRGLHVFGELLDLQGPIGGLNFQAAFATAELAARAATARRAPWTSP